MKLRVSVPAYVYIVNEDDQGEAYLLFPLPGQSVGNPLPAGTINRIPGTGGRADFDWQVTSVGGREHFLIFASPERMPALEEVFAALPRPELGRTLQSPRLPDEAIRRLRGVGGLTAKPPQGTSPKLAPSLLDAARRNRGNGTRTVGASTHNRQPGCRSLTGGVLSIAPAGPGTLVEWPRSIVVLFGDSAVIAVAGQ